MIWYKKSKEEVFQELHVKNDKGITELEAQKRLQQYGHNRLATNRKKTWVERIFSQINNVLIYV